MYPITKEEIIAYSQGEDAAYWARSLDSRWPYIEGAIEIYNKVRPSSVLELGSAGLPIIHGSTSMDRNFNPDILWDATDCPWPIAAKKFDMFIGLQVFEHLEGRQVEAFKEVKRIANHAVLSLPFEWTRGTPCHQGIDMEVIHEWTGQPGPDSVRYFHANGLVRVLLHWRF